MELHGERRCHRPQPPPRVPERGGSGQGWQEELGAARGSVGRAEAPGVAQQLRGHRFSSSTSFSPAPAPRVGLARAPGSQQGPFPPASSSGGWRRPITPHGDRAPPSSCPRCAPLAADNALSCQLQLGVTTDRVPSFPPGAAAARRVSGAGGEIQSFSGGKRGGGGGDGDGSRRWGGEKLVALRCGVGWSFLRFLNVPPRSFLIHRVLVDAQTLLLPLTFSSFFPLAVLESHRPLRGK